MSIGAGVAGVRPIAQTIMRKVMLSEAGSLFFPGGVIIDGAHARDPDNTLYPYVLRGGMILGKITLTKKFAPSVFGVSTVATTSTALTVSIAAATEIVRRIGTSGSITLTGAPTATGAVVSTVLVYNSIDLATGIITLNSNSTTYVAGSYVGPVDGSETPRVILTKPDGITCMEVQTGINLDVPLAEALIFGQVDVNQVVNYPVAANTTQIAWLKAALRATSLGYTFNDDWTATGP